LVLLISLGGTFGVHYLCRPFWMDLMADHSGVSIFESSFTIVLLPIFLLIINYRMAKRFSATNTFFINAVIVFACVLISAQLHFKNWADTVGSHTNPGDDVLHSLTFERILGLVVTAIGTAIAFYKINKARRSQKQYFARRDHHS